MGFAPHGQAESDSLDERRSSMILLPTTRGEQAAPGKTPEAGGIVLGLVLCLGIAAGLARAAEPPSPGAQPTDRQQRLAERDRLRVQTRKLQVAGRLDEAVAAAEKMLAIERQLYGNVDPEIAVSVAWLAQLHAEHGDFAAARQAIQEVLELEAKLQGVGDWQATDARPALAERNRLREHTRKLQVAGRLDEAVAAAEKMLAIERQLFGNVHSEIVGSVQWLARLHAEREDFAAAHQACQEVLELETKLHGVGDWRVTDARLAVAEVDRLAGLAPEPRRLLAEADRLNQRVVGLIGQGKSEAALEPARRALEIRKQVLGERHPDYATSLNNLAVLYRSMGDYAKAEPLFRQALEINKQVLGERHSSYAAGLNNLAELYESMGDYARPSPSFARPWRSASRCWASATPPIPPA